MKSLPFFSSPEDRHLTFDMLDHLRIFIETIEQDFITLPRFWDEFLKVVAVLHASFNEYAIAFAYHFEGRYQAMGDGTLAQLSYIFSAGGLGWLPGLNTGHYAQAENVVEALLGSEQYSLSKSDLVKKLHQPRRSCAILECMSALIIIFNLKDRTGEFS
jgi:hypothetical protein